MNDGLNSLELSSLPSFTLKKINEGYNFDTIVESFNYNVDQLYNHFAEKFEISLSGYVFPEALPGLSIVGDRGERGNNIFSSTNSLANNQIVTNTSHLESDLVIDRNGNVYEIIEVSSVLRYSLQYSLVDNITATTYLKQESVVSNSITSSSLKEWDDSPNEDKGNLGFFEEENGIVSHYRVFIGDHKKNDPVNGTLTITNLIETENNNSGNLSTSAVSSTSRDFSQLTFKYRDSHDAESLNGATYFRYYQDSNNGFFQIQNGENSLTLNTAKDYARHVFSDTRSGSTLVSNAEQVSLFSTALRIYSDDTDFYVESGSNPTAQSLVVNLNLQVNGNIFSDNLANTNGDYIIQDGVVNSGFLADEMEQDLIDLDFVQDPDYVRTDNNLTDDLLTRLELKPDYSSAESEDNAILNKPILIEGIYRSGTSVVPRGVHPNGSAVNFPGITLDEIAVTTGRVAMANRSSGVNYREDDNFTENYNYAYPPTGFTIAHLIGFLPTISKIRFAGNVDEFDLLWCGYQIDNTIGRVIINMANSESNITIPSFVNYIGIWKK